MKRCQVVDEGGLRGLMHLPGNGWTLQGCRAISGPLGRSGLVPARRRAATADHQPLGTDGLTCARAPPRVASLKTTTVPSGAVSWLLDRGSSDHK